MVLFSNVVRALRPSISKRYPRLTSHSNFALRYSTCQSGGHTASQSSSTPTAGQINQQPILKDQLTELKSSPVPELQPSFSGDDCFEEKNALDICNEDISSYAPPLQPSASFAAYVNESPTLQELVKLNVQLWKFEKRPSLCNYILSLDYDRDIKNHLLFLHRIGVPGEKFGFFITINPHIFKEDLDNLQIRVNYLESKKFTPHEIAQIVTGNPKWLSIKTQEIDSRLGFLQQTFGLTGNEVRAVTIVIPDVITKETADITAMVFSLKEEMGFSDDEIRTIVVAEPTLLSYKKRRVLESFNEIHNEVGIAHELIVKQPRVLMAPTHLIHYRGLYLKMLKRDQYDPKKENYVSLNALIDGTDVDFCRNVAKTSVDSYNTFLKTM